ncbi:hypothetical protein TIFTF001_029783 [Ficus carica]|uniref:Uncharacterized protein n=1 Tax=Ficus carica TaxID=3494 RepID=A0AA88DS99_FICCA|nr:hypothetical protein TIFTF001_029783 [Ficus carica]
MMSSVNGDNAMPRAATAASFAGLWQLAAAPLVAEGRPCKSRYAGAMGVRLVASPDSIVVADFLIPWQTSMVAGDLPAAAVKSAFLLDDLTSFIMSSILGVPKSSHLNNGVECNVRLVMIASPFMVELMLGLRNPSLPWGPFGICTSDMNVNAQIRRMSRGFIYRKHRKLMRGRKHVGFEPRVLDSSTESRCIAGVVARL